jgi:hypothetical protein
MKLYWREQDTQFAEEMPPEGPVVIGEVSVHSPGPLSSDPEIQIRWERPDGWVGRAGGGAEIPGTPQHALRLLEREFAKPGSLNRPLVNACLDKLWDTVVRGEK